MLKGYQWFMLYRELEEDFTSLAATVEQRESTEDDEGAKHCPICTVVELRDDNQNCCVDCERFVCLDCGYYDTSIQTKVREFYS